MSYKNISEIEFTIKDAWFLPIFDCRLIFDADGATIVITDTPYGDESPVKQQYSPEEAGQMKKRFSDIHTESWDDKYEPVGYDVLDGTSWSLSVRYTDDSGYTRSGSNAWPDNWRLLLEFFGVHKDL